jgi:hypothetical protein
MSLRHDSPKETLCERQSPRHPKTTFAEQLVCPHCHTAFPVTWQRYLSAPLGNYRCPKCRQISHATANYWWVLLIIFVAMTLIGIVGALFGAYVWNNIHHHSKTRVISVFSWSNTLLFIRRDSEFFP